MSAGESECETENTDCYKENAEFEADMKYEYVKPGMWVIVMHEGEKFLGKVQSKKEGQYHAALLCQKTVSTIFENMRFLISFFIS